ncbi:MAG: DUF2191 domain-containing protein [Spirochaetes bacterium]|nr:DUF2191 domain-containing protein [Spirochaetota bacterium]
MKVTAIIPDNLVEEVKQYSGGKNITESIIVALEEWLSLKKIIELNSQIERTPLVFTKNYSSSTIRSLNRNR